MTDAEKHIFIRDVDKEDEVAKTEISAWMLGWTGPPKRHLVWPMPPKVDHYLVAEWDGLIVGRVLLEAAYPPYAELINLIVRADYRRRGIGRALVNGCVERAARMGFKVIHLQSQLDDRVAHRLYRNCGFLPATQGKMLRMIRFIDDTLLSLFLMDHPLAEFASRSSELYGERHWDLIWRDPLSEDVLMFTVVGGSCDRDSDDIGPAVSGMDLRWGEDRLRAYVSCISSACAGEVVEVATRMSTSGGRHLNGVCRALLPPHLEVIGGAGLDAVSWELTAEEEEEVVLPVYVREDFPVDRLKYLVYPSVPITIEVYWGERKAMLSRSVRIPVCD